MIVIETSKPMLEVDEYMPTTEYVIDELCVCGCFQSEHEEEPPYKCKTEYCRCSRFYLCDLEEEEG